SANRGSAWKDARHQAIFIRCSSRDGLAILTDGDRVSQRIHELAVGRFEVGLLHPGVSGSCEDVYRSRTASLAILGSVDRPCGTAFIVRACGEHVPVAAQAYRVPKHRIHYRI